MALQLAPAGGQDPYGAGQQRSGRPQSQYYGENPYGSSQAASRTRSQSMGAQRLVTKNGQPILHYCKSHTSPALLEQCANTTIYSSSNVHVPSCHPRRTLVY
jgi:hypothetical protein